MAVSENSAMDFLVIAFFSKQGTFSAKIASFEPSTSWESKNGSQLLFVYCVLGKIFGQNVHILWRCMRRCSHKLCAQFSCKLFSNSPSVCFLFFTSKIRSLLAWGIVEFTTSTWWIWLSTVLHIYHTIHLHQLSSMEDYKQCASSMKLLASWLSTFQWRPGSFSPPTHVAAHTCLVCILESQRRSNADSGWWHAQISQRQSMGEVYLHFLVDTSNISQRY